MNEEIGNRRRAFQVDLLRWFRAHRRDLPWRRRRTPYRVWVAELMLQQTRTDQVVDYYRRFLGRFPTLRALAGASRRQVLKAWEGLGYYARARNLHDAARLIVREKAGRFPRRYEDLLALPGVGPYSAAAIGSLALGLDVAVVDGNVERVLARVMAFPGDAKSVRGRAILQSWAQSLLSPGRAGEMNEAIMELGALCCLPRRPRCPECPLRRVCAARREGRPERYPVRAARQPIPHKTVGAGIVVDRRGWLLIAQRRETSMLGGLWEFPGGTREPGESIPGCIARELKEELGITTRVGARFMIVRHTYSHFRMTLHAHGARIIRGRPRAIHCADWKWVPVSRLRRYPFSRADLRIVEALEASKGGVPA
jgi:A/G-specific adenine glycosylase